MSAECTAQAGASLPCPSPTLAARLAPVLGAIAAILVLYHETVWSMVLIWSRSQTFAHGFVIVPISAWLIWKQRHDLADIRQRPSAGGFVLLLSLGAAWLLAYVANVQVVTHYAVTAMIPAAVIATLGWQVAWAIAFPLAYLLLAVPFGEVFVPPLIDFTAQFTVGALQLTGIPVFRENNYFSIPSGNWSVVEACSGLRYVIASLALGTLYAYLNYRSTRRRLVFIAIALFLPIVANGIRAYLIVMIGHWSDMRLAVGIDHLIYGWVFFGLVSLLLFWVGSFWRDQPASAPPAAVPSRPLPPMSPYAYAAAVGIAIAACWPVLAASLLDAQAARAHAGARLAIAGPAPAWAAAPADASDWRAAHAGAPARFAQSYRGARGPVNLQLAWYASQTKGAELLTQTSHDDRWHAIDERTRTITAGGREITLRQSILQGERRRLLVWRWYRQGGVDTSNAFLVKLLLAKGKLLHTAEDGAEIILAAPLDDLEAAELALHDFLAAMLPAIDRSLSDAARH